MLLPSHMRPPSRPIATLAAVVMAVLALSASPSCTPSNTTSSPRRESGSPKEAFVLIDSDNESRAGILIQDRETIRDWIEKPIQNAIRDPHPARYEVFGSIRTVMDDGSEDWIVLFLPWGRIKRGDEYLIADLDQLHRIFSDRIKEAARRLSVTESSPSG
jgi:hypothetical protein